MVKTGEYVGTIYPYITDGDRALVYANGIKLPDYTDNTHVLRAGSYCGINEAMIPARPTL